MNTDIKEINKIKIQVKCTNTWLITAQHYLYAGFKNTKPGDTQAHLVKESFFFIKLASHTISKGACAPQERHPFAPDLKIKLTSR